MPPFGLGRALAARGAFSLYLLTAVALGLAACGGDAPEADLLLTGGRVYTLDSEDTVAEAVAIRGGRIVCVGAVADCGRGGAAQVSDITGKTVVPGLTDAHAHLSGVGLREMQLDLAEVGSLEELQAKVRAEAAGTAPGEWIIGRGWIEARWDPPAFPTRLDLDAAAPDHLVWLVRADGHAAVANSAALRLAGIDRLTRAPDGGEILRDPATGRATGMLIDRAKSLVEKHLPRTTPERLREALILGSKRYAERGWTGISIAGAGWDEIEMLRELVASGEITIRVYAAVAGPGPAAERLLEEGPHAGDGLLTVRGIKIVMDGALGSRGAALLEPYSDSAAGSAGLMMHPPGSLDLLLDRALRQGIQVQTHAIGDRGNRETLDAYARALDRVPSNERAVVDPRWRVEHAQILASEDLPRFAALGVIASMQPSHAITDFHFAPSRLGAGRLGGAYAWRSLVDSGARVVGGSDAPVEKGDPIVELYAAAVRRDLRGFADDNWHREQRLTREEALRLFTDWAAYARFEEDDLGTIEVGKKADLTVLTGDFFEVTDEEIPSLQAAMTIVDGRVIATAGRR